MMNKYNFLIIGLLTAIFLALSWYIFNASTDINAQKNIVDMKKNNDAIKDSLEKIILENIQQDKEYKIKIDSVETQLEIMKSLSSKLNPRLNVINKKISAHLSSWDNLSQAQKDSIITSAIRLNK